MAVIATLAAAGPTVLQAVLKTPAKIQVLEPFGAGALMLVAALSAFRLASRERDEDVRTLADEHQRLQQVEHRITYLSNHDALTGMLNRAELQHEVNPILLSQKHRGGSSALLLVDLDRLRLVNEAYGYAAGDLLLQAVGARLAGCSRRSDRLARLSGGQFAVFVNEIHHTGDAMDVASCIVQELGIPYPLNRNELAVTAGVGIALFPTDGQDLDGLLRAAESALREAKQQGSGQVKLHAPRVAGATRPEPSLEWDLRRALERNELVLHFQPQVHVETRRLYGVEVLVRWQHPTLGLLGPGRFIPVAEQTGLIVPLTEWVLNEACRQACAWQNAGYQPVTVAVNLSARQFQQRNVVPMVLAALAASGLEPHHLEVEITEGASMQDPEYTLTVLRALKEAGLEISLDDFGTGFSSLNYLQRFPFDTIKIDQSFVRNITTETGSAAIVGAIVNLARGLGRKVIAEGVETEQQLLMLRMRGCQQVQGYLFSKPVPAAELERLLLRMKHYGLRPPGTSHEHEENLLQALVRYSYPMPPTTDL